MWLFRTRSGRALVLSVIVGALLGGTILGTAVPAAEPRVHGELPAISRSWKKLVSAQFAAIHSVFVQDEYMVWVERKLTPATEGNVVQTFGIGSIGSSSMAAMSKASPSRHPRGRIRQPSAMRGLWSGRSAIETLACT